MNHQRMKLRFDGQAFIAGNESYHLEDLLEKVQNEPESFSTNVAARPVLQNIILPVIAYIAGPSEIAYHRQLGDYHLFHGTSMPCLVPRLSATFIPPDAARILETCQLNPWDQIPHNWQDVFPLIQQKGEAMIAQWQECAKHFFDKDLSLSAIERYAKLGGKKLIHRAYKAHIQKKGLSGESLHLLKNLINPHNNPQERLLNWWGFQTKTQENFKNKDY